MEDDHGAFGRKKIIIRFFFSTFVVFFLRFVCALASTEPLQGGVKLLVTGPWRQAVAAEAATAAVTTSRYQVLFDGVPVPTVLVQDGVLRCQVPGERKRESERETMS